MTQGMVNGSELVVEAGHDALGALVAARFERSISEPQRFFAAEAQRIAEACWAIARRFHQGGRLLAFGNGAWATDAQHVAVEFVHPVIVGKRALPALALTNDSTVLSARSPGSTPGVPFAQQLSLLARPEDIALGFYDADHDDNILSALRRAREMGCLTLGLAGGQSEVSDAPSLDFCFAVPSRDPMLVQEIHETLYHVLWELVHVFFEHEGLLT